MAHLLNGCKEFKDVYSSRRDKVVSKLAIELGPFWNEMHVNKCVSTSLPFVSQDDLLSLKPDVVLLKGSNCVICRSIFARMTSMQTKYMMKKEENMLHCLKKLNAKDLGVPLNL